MSGLLAVFTMNCSCLCVQPVESGRGTGMLGMLMLSGTHEDSAVRLIVSIKRKILLILSAQKSNLTGIDYENEK